MGIRLGTRAIKHVSILDSNGHGSHHSHFTNSKSLKAKPHDKDFTPHAGGDLFLLVKTSGKKFWRFRYQRPATNQQTTMGLGAFPPFRLLMHAG